MIHNLEAQVLILLLVATIVGMAARRIKLPYTLALVVAGLVLGFVKLEALSSFELSAELLLLLLLPALLFEAAFHIEWPNLRREMGPIFTLALPGVAIAIVITGGLMYLALNVSGIAPQFELVHAFLFASLISATDPISVLALFRELGVTRRLYLLVEGESLLNDGVAVVAFFIVLAIFGVAWGGNPAPELHGTSGIVSYALVTFVKMAVGGVLVGVLIGGLVSAITHQIDDHLLEITLTTLVAYGSFLIAESLHLSGVLSTVTAGLIVGHVGEGGMSPHTKRAVEDFWEYMAFLANSFIFLLVGLKLDPGNLASDVVSIAIGFAVITAARAVVVYGLTPISNRFSRLAVPLRWRHVMVWGGLRGSLSMVLVLSLPTTFPGRSLLLTLVFGVVALSLFGQGLSIKPLLARLGLLRGVDAATDYSEARGRVLAARRAIAAAGRLHEDGLVSDRPYARLLIYYESMLARAQLEAAERAGASQLDEQLVEGMRRLAEIERETLRHASHTGVITEDVAADLDGEILRRMHAIERAADDGEEALNRYFSQMEYRRESDESEGEAAAEPGAGGADEGE